MTKVAKHHYMHDQEDSRYALSYQTTCDSLIQGRLQCRQQVSMVTWGWIGCTCQGYSMNKAQAGSRPAHTYVETVTSKVMKYMHSNLTRTPMATMDNDAKSCYD